eukprot:scaffold4562_cov255-Pinguiococcus_pyrenoidosus.AAC.19
MQATPTVRFPRACSPQLMLPRVTVVLLTGSPLRSCSLLSIYVIHALAVLRSVFVGKLVLHVDELGGPTLGCFCRTAKRRDDLELAQDFEQKG